MSEPEAVGERRWAAFHAIENTDVTVPISTKVSGVRGTDPACSNVSRFRSISLKTIP